MPHKRAARSLQPNRADLTRPNVQQVPGQQYGEAAQQRAGMQAIPLPVQQQARTPTPPAAGGAVSSSAAPGVPSALPGAPMVGANGPLTRPTERPNEPITHGLPMGPGAGPEALQGVGAAARQGAVEQGTLAHLLTSLASGPNATSAIKDLAARAQGGAL
jgi:hypothetical protein